MQLSPLACRATVQMSNEGESKGRTAVMSKQVRKPQEEKEISMIKDEKDGKSMIGMIDQYEKQEMKHQEGKTEGQQCEGEKKGGWIKVQKI